MSSLEFLTQSPPLIIATVLIAIIIVAGGVMFISGYNRSKFQFWSYVMHLDFMYPVKPNSRQMLNTIRRGFDKNEASSELLFSIMDEARAIKQSLEDFKSIGPDPKLERALTSIDNILHSIKVSQETTGTSSLPRTFTGEDDAPPTDTKH